MLELKGMKVKEVRVLPGMQRIHLRLVGFRGATVPAIKLDGRRIQGSRQIARALEELKPQPPLFPADPELRRRVEEAERWGEQELQGVPRRILRWGLVHDVELRTWMSAESDVPAPAISARLSGPNARYYARAVDSNDSTVQRDLAQLHERLDRADSLLADGTLSIDAPNAAAFQVLSTVRALDALADLHPHVGSHRSAAVARQLLPAYPDPVPPFLPREWLAVLARR